MAYEVCDLVGNIFTETEVVAKIRTELEKVYVDYGRKEHIIGYEDTSI